LMRGIAHAEGLAAGQCRLIPIANRIPAERVSESLATRPFKRRGEPRIGRFQGDARGCLGALVQKKNAGEDTRYANHKISTGNQGGNVGFARARQAFETISAFKHRNQAAGAVRVGKFQHQQSEFAEVVVGE
jgi:hypothetical protein